MGIVSAVDRTHGRRGLSPAVVLGLGISVAVHAALLVFLHSQRFTLETPI
ncbi:MAG: hypothetical protein AVDCRST_MAG91-1548, partial [uncultured Sphingomonadaceae bacterium]